MRRGIIVDTGPLVAWLDESDQWHQRAVERTRSLQPPFVICEAVLTEACFLLRRYPQALAQIGSWMERGRIEVTSLLESSHKTIFKLMAKYRDLPMSLADACLVYMADARPGIPIFTFDRHFALYRAPSRRKVKTIGLEE